MAARRTPLWLSRAAVWVAWAYVASQFVVFGSAWAGVVRPWPIIGLQATVVLTLLGAWAVLGAAWSARRRALAACAMVLCVAHLWVVVPLARPENRPTPADGQPTVRIGSFNLLYLNDQQAEGAAMLATLEVDALVLTEVTPDWETAMREADVFDRFPHQAGRIAAGNATGSLIISRSAFVSARFDKAVNRNVHSVELMVGDEPLRVMAVHPQSPSSPGLVASWEAQIDALVALAREHEGALAMVGDVNASYFNPPFRRLLAAGLRDAHDARGEGLTTSFPIGILPFPVTRIDHALVTDDVAVLDVDDVAFPGSDHRGFVVTLGVA